jgi:hypothetical protein
MKRSAPMKRTGFARKPGSPFSSFANRGTALRRSAMKRRVRKPTVEEGGRYLAACRGEPCYLLIPGVCRRDPRDRTVVPCHSNLLEHGGGMGLKADHRNTFPGCDLCHFWLDQSDAPTKQERRDATYAALERWLPVRERKMAALEATR